MTTIFPVIMCGGAGTRMWPLSRKVKPKQYHAVITENSMLQETLIRLSGQTQSKVAAPSFVCAAQDEAEIISQCRKAGVSPHKIILEPMGRNTAPVAAAISQIIRAENPDALILLLPADHHIEDKAEFWRCVEKGVGSANTGHLVTLGIFASAPETGYGYIRAGSSLDEDVYSVEAFVEKPDLRTAKEYLAEGGYYWNAGIFLFAAKTMLDAFADHANDILQDTKVALSAARVVQNSIFLDADAFAKCRSESIDYAIMEHADKVAVVAPVNVGWNDIGSWAAVRDMTNASGSSAVGDIIAIDCEDAYIRTDGPLITAVGVKDLIIVATGDSVLVIPADRAQDVKTIVAELKKAGRDDKL